MFSSHLWVFRPSRLRASRLCPLKHHPEPNDRSFRLCRKGSAFLYPLTAPNSHASQAHPRFRTTTFLRTHGNTLNSNPLIRLPHNILEIPGVMSVLAASSSFASSQGRVSSAPSCLAPSLEQPPTAIPFRICTYAKSTRNSCRIRSSKTHHFKSFRIRTYEKRGGGVQGGVAPNAFSESSVVHLLAYRSILRTAL